MVEVSQAAIVNTTKAARLEGTLELTIKRAELKGEPLPAYT